MSNPLQTVLEELNQKSMTLGWDVVIACNAQKINELFALQYVNNVKGNTHLPPINGTVELGNNMELQLSNVTLGPPLISFPTTPGTQDAVITMSLLTGDVILLQQFGSVQVATGHQQISPGLNLSVQMTVPLSDVTGSVTGQHDVVVNLQNANNFSVELMSGADPGYVGEYFQKIFAEETNATLTYNLGTLITDDSSPNSLIPVMFDIRTLPNPGTNGQDGAVLLLVATNYNPTAGTVPDASYPYILPDGNNAALLLSSKTLFGDIIQPQYQSMLTGSPTFAVDQFATASPASYLAFTGGNADVGVITHSWSSNLMEYRVWSGDKDNTQDALIPFAGLSIQPQNDLLAVGWSQQFSQEFGYSESGFKSGYTSDTHVNITISANFTATAAVDPTGKYVSFNANGQPDVTVNFESSSWISKWFSDGDIKDQASKRMAQTAQTAVGQVFDISLPQLDIFATTHLLFPSANYLQYSQAYVPGDLAIFGQVSPQQTAFSISPLQSATAPQLSLQFSANASDVSWNISPRIGAISPSGMYSPPQQFSEQVNILVEANAGSNNAAAVLTLLPNPVSTNISHLILFAGAGPQQISATVVANLQPITWELFPADGSVGTIDQSGLYTPPQAFPAGVSLATIRVTAGGESNYVDCAMLLCSSELALNIDPPFVVVPGNQSQQFTVTNAGGETISWDVQPEIAYGEVSNDGLFTPRNVQGGVSAFITATSSSGAMGVAVAVISPE